MEQERKDDLEQMQGLEQEKTDASGQMEESERKRREDIRQIKEIEQNRRRTFVTGAFTGALMLFTVVLLAIAIMSYKYQILLISRNSTQKTEEAKQENPVQSESAYQEVFKKLSILNQYIDKYYIYDTEDAQYMDGIYKGYVESLGDKYSTYYSADEFKDLTEKTNGSYCGLGAYVSQDEAGRVYIVKPIKGSEAERLGIQPDDIVYSVDGKLATGEDLSTVTSWLKGEEGTTAQLVIYRNGEEMEFTVVRSVVEDQTVDYRMLEDQLGYIQIATFETVTTKQYIEAVDDLDSQGANGLIIDLRDNGGGVFDSAITMVDRMLKDGRIVSVKNKSGEEKVYETTDQLSYDKPVVILINKNTASASEVFSGAMKDHGLATLVGQKSYGKGIVQTIMSLADGSAIKLTTAEYYSPNGTNIQGTGFEPDVEVELDLDAFTDGYSLEEDSQIQKAIEVLKEKVQ